MNHSISGTVSCPVGSAPYSAGMTFIELLITISIVAILLTVAVPSFISMLQSNRFAAFSNAYLTNLHLARSEAIKRNGRVALCKSADSATCTSDGYWSQGWLVFRDVNNNAQVDVGEDILRVHEALPINLVLLGNANVASYVSFANTGNARLTSGAFQAGTLTLCQPSATGGEARQIVINATGRPRVQKAIVATCP